MLYTLGSAGRVANMTIYPVKLISINLISHFSCSKPYYFLFSRTVTGIFSRYLPEIAGLPALPFG